jgi:hypothetical protein
MIHLFFDGCSLWMASLIAKLGLHGSRRIWMKLDALSKRLEILEARIKPIDPTADFLAKRSDEELDLLIAILTAQEEGRELELTPEQERMLCR